MQLEEEMENYNINWKKLTYHRGLYFLGTLYNLFAGFLTSLSLMLTNEIKIIHIRGYLPGLIIWPQRYFLNSKLLFDMRGFWPDEKADRAGWSREGRKYKFFKSFEKKLLKSSDAVVALTKESLEILAKEKKDIQLNSEVIRTCVDRSVFKPYKTEKTNNKINLCHLGSVDTAYDLDPILDFVKSINEKESLKIHFLNKGKEEFIIEKCQERGIEEKNYSITYMEPNEISKFLSNIDLGCFYAKENFSIKASMPTKIAEFMSCGVPILCNPFNSDIITIFNNYHVGFLHNFKHSEGNRMKFEEIKVSLVDSDIRTRCINLSEELFDLRKGAESYRKIYRKLVDKANFDI
jgi:glycosyltransferase involved in cell wall biosynthesis